MNQAGFIAELKHILNSVSLFFLILTCMGVGAIGILLMIEITKLFTSVTLQYLKWNLNFIQRKKA